MGVLFLKPIYCIRLKNILIIAFALILLCFCVCAASVSEPDGLKLYVLMYHQVSEKPSKYGNYVVSPAELENEALFFRVYAPDGTELTGSSASVGSEDGSLSANGEYTGSFVLQKCDIGDTFTLEAFNCMEKNIYGRVEMIAK